MTCVLLFVRYNSQKLQRLLVHLAVWKFISSVSVRLDWYSTLMPSVALSSSAGQEKRAHTCSVHFSDEWLCMCMLCRWCTAETTTARHDRSISTWPNWRAGKSCLKQLTRRLSKMMQGRLSCALASACDVCIGHDQSTNRKTKSLVLVGEFCCQVLIEMRLLHDGVHVIRNLYFEKVVGTVQSLRSTRSSFYIAIIQSANVSFMPANLCKLNWRK